VVVGLPEFLRGIGDYRMLVFGGILMATMLFGEGGLAALLRLAVHRLAALRPGLFRSAKTENKR
jgi:hypothetical protein